MNELDLQQILDTLNAIDDVEPIIALQHNHEDLKPPQDHCS